jgi:hypothetical protein
LGDPIVRIFGTYLHIVIESRDLGSPDIVVFHMGTNDLRRIGNLDYVLGDVYDLVNMAKIKFQNSESF